MSLVSTPGIVLQSFRYSETSKIVRLFTRDHGLQSVIAKGAQRPRSRFGGLLELFSEGRAEFRARAGRDLHTLSEWELLRSRQRLGDDLVRFAGASLLAELVLRAGTEEAQPEVYVELRDAFDELLTQGEPGADSTIVASAWHLVSLLGFAPQTDACVGCGVPITPDEDARFDAVGGGVSCARCRPAGRVLQAVHRRELARMTSRAATSLSVSVLAVHRRLLHAFLDAQLGNGRPFRSMELLLEQVAVRSVA